MALQLLITARNAGQRRELIIEKGCKHEVFMVIGPPTKRMLKYNSKIVSNLRKNQVWIYIKGLANLTITRQSENINENFLKISLHNIDMFWENNDDHFSQNKGSFTNTIFLLVIIIFTIIYES